MTDLRPSARAWVDLVVIAAIAATLGLYQVMPAQGGDWVGFALLLLCGSVAHVFPIRPAFDNVTYHLTSAFMLAGAMLLSPPQLGLLAAAALAPDLWLRRSVPGVHVLWAFNAAQTCLASLAALVWLNVTHTRQLETPQDAIALLVAVALFTFVQAILVGVVVALNSQKSLLKAGTLSRAALLSDFAIGLGGLLVGGLWLVKPMLVLTAPALLVMLHRATRNAHLAELADRDPKTGLYNARYLGRALDEALQRARRDGRSVAILFADLDRFKRVNDLHGHEVGDLVLRGVAQTLEQQVGRAGLVARYGGEEFVMLLPRANEEQAATLAEALRQEVERHPFEAPGGGAIACTISIGLTIAPTDGTDAHALLEQADAALREAKTTRNCVARWGGASTLFATQPVPRQAAPSAAPSHMRAGVMLWITVAGGAVGVLWSLLWTINRPELWSALVPFMVAAVFAEFLSVDVYRARQQRITLSFSMAATMAAVAAQPTAAPLVNVVAATVAMLVVVRQRHAQKLLFNLANPVLASLAAASTYAAMRPASGDISVWSLGVSLVAVLVYVGVNVGLVSLMISLHSGRRLMLVLRDSGWFAPTNVLLGLTGAFVGGSFAQLGPVVVAMFVTPVLLMRYTLAFYARRSQETIRTLERQATTLEQQADRLEHLAMHDGLTELPNRLGLEGRLNEVLADRAMLPVALLVLDLKRFKEINDTFGHHHGDLLLREIGPRLRTILREQHTIARLGGDEFAVMLQQTTAHQAEQIASNLRAALTHPFVINGYPVDVDASVGVAAATDEMGDAITLLRQADVALDIAKREQAGYALYRPEYDQHSPERLSLVGELRQAIENDGLTLVYQPQVSCRSGCTVDAEALLRWHHPTRGTIPPDEFVPLAERTGLIRPLTRWVMERVVRQSRAWLDAGYMIPIAVNASMHDLHDVTLPAQIARLLDTWQIPPSCLRIEVTEGTLMSDARRSLEILGGLRTLGLEIAVDDFGTGYSSLAYLSRLPLNELKIDRSFVGDMRTNEPKAAIVRSTISLGHDLGLRVVAEGVEDEATWRLLRRFGCDSVQGFWIARPLPPSEFIHWLETSGWSLCEHPDQNAA